MADKNSIDEDQSEIVNLHIERICVGCEEGLIDDDALVVHLQLIVLKEIELFFIFQSGLAQVGQQRSRQLRHYLFEPYRRNWLREGDSRRSHVHVHHIDDHIALHGPSPLLRDGGVVIVGGDHRLVVE